MGFGKSVQFATDGARVCVCVCFTILFFFFPYVCQREKHCFCVKGKVETTKSDAGFKTHPSILVYRSLLHKLVFQNFSQNKFFSNFHNHISTSRASLSTGPDVRS